MLGDAGQVADPVVVVVGKAARIDLVEDGAAPPVALERKAEVGGRGVDGLGGHGTLLQTM
ncbi:hypothetical protein LTR94_032279 [Friedmanniomyces endolithicus]|nr:hypothetical protein LTR94_032279 [Friedmanniomyces endolithicus]